MSESTTQALADLTAKVATLQTSETAEAAAITALTAAFAKASAQVAAIQTTITAAPATIDITTVMASLTALKSSIDAGAAAATAALTPGPAPVVPVVPVVAPVVTSGPSVITGALLNGAAAAPGTLAALTALVPSGGTLTLPAGTFSGTAPVPVACTIAGAGMGKTIIDCTGLRPSYGKATLLPLVPGVVIEDMTVRGAAVDATSGMNAAGVRDNGPGIGFTLTRVESTGNQNGVLTFPSNVTLNQCSIHDNGSASLANGQSATHELYFGGAPGTVVTINGCTVSTGTLATHALKSRAGTTVVNGSTLTAGQADGGTVSGSAIDIPDGGDFTMTGGSVTLRAGAANTMLLGYGLESASNLAAGAAVKLSGVALNGGGQATEIQNGAGIPTATLALASVTAVGTVPTIAGFASVVGAIAAG